MIDQLIIGDKGSYDDFFASVAERKIGQPKKKSIKETVPYSNVTYDFSAINGEVYYNERELEYIFEMTADTPEELEEMKAAFSNWVMNVFEEEIHDPFIPDYHFIGTYDDMDYADEETLDKTTATVKFTAYPYKVANVVKKYTFTIAGNSSANAVILNNSSHRITPKIKASGELTIKRTTASVIESWGIPASEEAAELTAATGEMFMLDAGITSLALQNSKSTACELEITFIEEVQ